MLAAFSLFDGVSAFGWLGPIMVGVMMVIVARAHSKQKTGQVWEETSAGWQSRAEQLQIEVGEQRALKHQLKSELAAQRMKTDLTEVMKFMSDMSKQIRAVADTQERTLTLIANLEKRVDQLPLG